MRFTIARKLTLALGSLAIIIGVMAVIVYWQSTGTERRLESMLTVAQTLHFDREIQPQAYQILADNGQQIQRSIITARQTMIAVIIFGLLLALVIYILLLRSIIRPLTELIAAHSAVAQGNLEQRAIVRAPDEIGDLAKSLNQLAVGLQHSVALEQRAMQSTLLRELTGLLQSSLTIEETYQIIASYAERLFPNLPGGLAMLSASKSQVRLTASWGATEILASTFQPSACWALRRSREHLSTSPEAGPVCAHFVGADTMPRFCVPMIIHGECIGILCLGSDAAHENHSVQSPEIQELAVMAADGIGLPLSNLKLQEDLRNLSIHDALTGLYNRRYLNEALTREFSRAERDQATIAVIMMDLDYFKQINDNYGHKAGDEVLKHTAHLISTNIRRGDIACRYGGEEFVLVLPKASLAQSRKRAEDLIKLFRTHTITYNNQKLDPVTCSMGIAIFPEDGRDAEEILQVADNALYLAKSQGRDRYCVPERLNHLPEDP